ncbi:MAG: tRNA (adenosine(37)-N6)-threonylcarbamoyltransferase complex dimerization subunit type 1 TsaB, partial [Methylocystis sp.]
LLEPRARASGVVAKVVDTAATPNIAFVAKLGLVANAADAPARPFYLKAPDAKPIERQGEGVATVSA